MGGSPSRGVSTMRGPRSLYLSGSLSCHTSGCSTKWSSTEMSFIQGCSGMVILLTGAFLSAASPPGARRRPQVLSFSSDARRRLIITLYVVPLVNGRELAAVMDRAPRCPVLDWAAPGAMALTGDPRAAPATSPAPVLAMLAAVSDRLARVTGQAGTAVRADPATPG